MIFSIIIFLNTAYDAKHKATKERGLKIFFKKKNSKKKVLAHIKTGNNSENL